jgi:hypothetical protein
MFADHFRRASICFHAFKNKVKSRFSSVNRSGYELLIRIRQPSGFPASVCFATRKYESKRFKCTLNCLETPNQFGRGQDDKGLLLHK